MARADGTAGTGRWRNHRRLPGPVRRRLERVETRRASLESGAGRPRTPPVSGVPGARGAKDAEPDGLVRRSTRGDSGAITDRKSTRLNSSHPSISYAVFCLKKKNI